MHMDVEEEIRVLKERNARVEMDKAWEISIFRKALVLITTYAVAAFALYVIGVPNFYLAAAIPALGFFLSTLTFPILKKMWIKKYFS